MTDRDELFALMQQGATIITPNNRLSNHLLASYARAQPAGVLEKPRCLPYQMYLQDLYRQHVGFNPQTAFPVLLSPQQLQFVWTDLLAKQMEDSLNQGLIDEVQEAWRRCQHWQLDHNHPAFSLTPQTRQCQEWISDLHAKLQQMDAISSEQLVAVFLQQHIRIEPGLIVWYCFDDYTPVQNSLQRYMQEQGCIVQHRDLPLQSESALIYEANDEDDERLQLVYWLKEQLAAGHQRIAVVVPDLHSQAPQLQRLLERHLPASRFDISLGQPLMQFPLVAHAFAWLHLGGQTLSHQQARLLLSSPYLAASKSEMTGRAEALQNCSALQEQSIDYAFFLADIARYAPELAKLAAELDTWPERASVHEWAERFVNRLQLVGFPGEYSLESEMYQCYHRFLSLFDEFKQLTMLTSSLTQTQALSALSALANSTVFQAQKTESDIQILGLLEASGCYFDRLWVMGVTDECLPQKIRMSAFIPVSLQRDYAMPHASPQRELSLANSIVERFKNSSETCVFSYPRLSKDKPNLPSPLVCDLPHHSPQTNDRVRAQPCLEQLVEQYELPFTADEPLTASSAVLANQAKCPFRAFADHRLQAKKGMGPADGPDPMERGKIIHKVLEVLWQRLQSQKQLHALPAAELENYIEQAIAVAIAPCQKTRQQSFPAVVQAVERKRLRQLVQACLDWERKRPAFEIDALEKPFTLELGGITFQLRVDRLDKLEGDKKWVIDYKTSLPQGMPWKEDRPREPQLLLYALLDEQINTLLFSELKAGGITCKGFGEEVVEEAGIGGLREGESWDDYRQHWRGILDELATEYRQGHCPPQPLSPSICQLCDFQSLCRFAYE